MGQIDVLSSPYTGYDGRHLRHHVCVDVSNIRWSEPGRAQASLKLMRHFLKMTPPFFEKNRTGDLMARATNDLRSVSQTAGFGMLTLTDSTAFLLIVLFAMFMIQWKLTLAALLPLPFIAIAMNVFGKRFMNAT